MAEPWYIEDSRLAEEAAAWLARLAEDDSAACRGAFHAWFKQSPRHVEEFLEATATLHALGELDPQCRIDIDSILAEAEPNIIALESGTRPSTDGTATLPPGAAERAGSGSGLHAGIASSASDARLRASFHRQLYMGFAALLIAAIATGSWFAFTSSDFSTAVGEQRTLKLADGSIVTLNTRSRIEVRFDSQRRDIRLLDGEALFLVARDPQRPFHVRTDEATVRALGTRFDVHRHSRGTTVSVIEGAVQVTPAQQGAVADAPRLTSGEQTVVSTEGRLSTRALPDPSTALAWRERRLEFHDAALADVAAEFNRYNTTQLVIHGEIDPNKRITGIFDADSPGALAGFLRKDATLQVDHTGSAFVIRSRPANQP